MTTALVHAARAGVGGLGLQAATAAAGLGRIGPIICLGPGRAPGWPDDPPGVRWEVAPPVRPFRLAAAVARHLRPGWCVFHHDRHVARWAAGRLDRLRPRLVYAFTQVGREALEWAKARGVPSVLDNPNGHIRGFADVYREEWRRWVGGRYRGHPTAAMTTRVEAEYALADRIRVSSEWARGSMVARGVPAGKVFVCPQPIDLDRFHPPPPGPAAGGPLRVVYVGSLDVRKGFAYLLRAVRAVGPDRVAVELVGATGDRGSRRLLAREAAGLRVRVAPGDPVAAYHRAELFVLPSLEDGFGFVAAEAMACGLPTVVTDRCGAAEWVRPGETGWVLPAGDAGALAGVFGAALADRAALGRMGAAARRAVEARHPATAFEELAQAVGGVPCAS